jgi:hypothetical protein
MWNSLKDFIITLFRNNFVFPYCVASLVHIRDAT